MRVEWNRITLWISQHRVEIRRAAIAGMLLFAATATARWALVVLIVSGTAVMFVGMKFGSRYQNLGLAMIAGKAHKQKRSKDTSPDSTTEPPV